MQINLWQPGETRYRTIDIDIGDKVLVKTWDTDLISGTVLDINIKDNEMILQIDNVMYSNYIYREGHAYHFDLDKAYGIDVVLTVHELKKIDRTINEKYLRITLNEFNDDFNFLSDNKLTEEDFENLLDVYTKNLENRTFMDTVFLNKIKTTLYDILVGLQEKYDKEETKVYKIDLGILNEKREIGG